MSLFKEREVLNAVERFPYIDSAEFTDIGPLRILVVIPDRLSESVIFFVRSILTSVIPEYVLTENEDEEDIIICVFYKEDEGHFEVHATPDKCTYDPNSESEPLDR